MEPFINFNLLKEKNSLHSEVTLFLSLGSHSVLRIGYCELPSLFIELNKTIRRLVDILNQSSNYLQNPDNLYDHELLQLLLFTRQISVSFEKSKITLTSFASDLNNVTIEHYKDSTSFEFEINSELPPIGSYWYAGESKWPIIGFIPEHKSFLFSEKINSESGYWLNKLININQFDLALKRLFLSEHLLVPFDGLYSEISYTIQKLTDLSH